jgi:hypothetical protein
MSGTPHTEDPLSYNSPGNPDRFFQLNRRMSGMPILDRFEKHHAGVDGDILAKVNDLLDRFPLPPAAPYCVSPNGRESLSTTPSAKSSIGGWGSIRGIAEKFNVFK